MTENKDAASSTNEQELVFGRNAVLSFLEESCRQHDDALTDGNDKKAKRPVNSVKINKVLIAQGNQHDPRLSKISALAHKLRVPVQSVLKKRLDQLAGPDKRHQGVIAMISAAEFWHLDMFLEKLTVDKLNRELKDQSMNGYMVAILDNIEDPHNLGAIIRVAEASGVQSLFLPQRRSVGLTGTVAKISAGALSSMPVVRVSNTVQLIETLKQYGFWVVGLDHHASEVYTKSDLKRPLALVIGSEGKGLGRLVRENCDFFVSIPMLGKTESLNASVAAGLVFYEVVRQNMPDFKNE